MSRAGKGYIVGAGPGRADLISVRGLRLLRKAEVVIYDRLVSRELIDEVRPEAERIFVGKEGYRGAAVSQPEVNALLVERVRRGLRVVRLKGGDGFVFGRGGEECLALADAGLPFEVVPGVSAAIAGPAYAGIPVTHRGLASVFAIVTGNEDPTKERSAVDWALMARLPTLVVLMGVRSAAGICEALIVHGRDPDSPAASISSATTTRQKVISSTVGRLAAALQEEKIEAPAVLVFGDVVSLHDRLDWFRPQDGGLGFVDEGESGRQKAAAGPP